MTSLDAAMLAIKPLPILLVLSVAACGKVDGDHRPSAAVQIAVFKAALDSLREDCGRFPTTEEGLAALCTRPAAMSETRWRGPYLDSRVPLDPWGHAYAYRCPGAHNTNSADIYSCGPDGVSKTGGDDPDDIANWPKRKVSQ